MKYLVAFLVGVAQDLTWGFWTYYVAKLDILMAPLSAVAVGLAGVFFVRCFALDNQSKEEIAVLGVLYAIGLAVGTWIMIVAKVMTSHG